MNMASSAIRSILTGRIDKVSLGVYKFKVRFYDHLKLNK